MADDPALMNMPHGVMRRFQDVEARLDELEAAEPPADETTTTSSRKAKSSTKPTATPSFMEDTEET